MSIFMGTKVTVLMRVLEAEKNKDTQRQASVISGQIGHNTVAEFSSARPLATEKQEQAGEVDRQAPSELNGIEQ